jgi:N-formylglutamate deformylase
MNLFTVYPPRSPERPIVANLPHSGMQVPDSVAAQFTSDHRQTLPNTDWHLDKLYRSLPDLGITMLQANYSRYVVDLNRQLQPPVFGDFWRSAIPEKTAFGQPIYQRLPTEVEIQERIEQFYLPYQQQLNALLHEKIARFGKVYLFDLHSFMGLIPDQICLGNGNGKTCSQWLISMIEREFFQHGYQVVQNKVFTGGYITRHYGQLPQVEALQIEVRYPVYLNPAQLEHNRPPDWQVAELDAAKRQFDRIFAAIVPYCI